MGVALSTRTTRDFRDGQRLVRARFRKRFGISISGTRRGCPLHARIAWRFGNTAGHCGDQEGGVNVNESEDKEEGMVVFVEDE